MAVSASEELHELRVAAARLERADRHEIYGVHHLAASLAEELRELRVAAAKLAQLAEAAGQADLATAAVQMAEDAAQMAEDAAIR